MSYPSKGNQETQSLTMPGRSIKFEAKAKRERQLQIFVRTYFHWCNKLGSYGLKTSIVPTL
eukprot:5061515-Amphidinium_carterae.1